MGGVDGVELQPGVMGCMLGLPECSTGRSLCLGGASRPWWPPSWEQICSETQIVLEPR